MNVRRDFLRQVAATALVTPAVSTLSPINWAADPSRLIIDAHQHLWDLEKQKLSSRRRPTKTLVRQCHSALWAECISSTSARPPNQMLPSEVTPGSLDSC